VTIVSHHSEKEEKASMHNLNTKVCFGHGGEETDGIKISNTKALALREIRGCPTHLSDLGQHRENLVVQRLVLLNPTTLRYARGS
jgi:hypothetical protein